MKTGAIVGKTNLRDQQLSSLKKMGVSIFDTNISDKSEDEVIERLCGVQVAVVNVFTPISEYVLNKTPLIETIISCSSGINHIDLLACKKRGINVTWYKSYCARTVAEKTFAYILIAMNNIIGAHENYRGGKWDYLSFQGRELINRSITILGCGSTGSLVAEFSRAFGMDVYCVNSKTDKNDVVHYISSSDVIAICMDMNSSTDGYINCDLLSHMKPNVVIVNTSRGGLIVEADLFAFMTKNPAATAFLDVLVSEPPSEAVRASIPKNVLITPHIGWNSAESDKFLADNVFSDFNSALHA